MKMRSFVALALLPAAVACGFPKATDAAPPLTAEAVKKGIEMTPGATQESLEEGRAYFVARCNQCHGYPVIAAIATTRWPKIIQEMGKKADLDKTHSDEVLHYIQAVAPREAIQLTTTPTAY